MPSYPKASDCASDVWDPVASIPALDDVGEGEISDGDRTNALKMYGIDDSWLKN